MHQQLKDTVKHTQKNKKKLKQSLVTLYHIQPGNESDLVLYLHGLHKAK